MFPERRGNGGHRNAIFEHQLFPSWSSDAERQQSHVDVDLLQLDVGNHQRNKPERQDGHHDLR